MHIYTDLHCHWDDERYHSTLDQLVALGAERGIGYWISSALDPMSVQFHKQLHQTYQRILYSIGIHPFDTAKAQTLIPEMETMLQTATPVAIGECGLDFYDGQHNRSEQTFLFLRQCEWAESFQIPLILHLRKSYYEFAQLLRRIPRLKSLTFIFHSFSGPIELIHEFLSYNTYFSFSAAFISPRALQLQAKLRAIPMERLLLETDAPYIKPFRFEGEINYPHYLEHIYQKAAATREIALQEMSSIIYKNFCRLFFKQSAAKLNQTLIKEPNTP